MARLVPDYFDEGEMAVFTGGPDVGVAFSRLAFDHLIFTGATSVGRHIMRAAADNLVPVTLELGGKSPTFIGRSANKDLVGQRVALGKIDRKSVVEGRSVSIRVDLGGRRILKKKNQLKQTLTNTYMTSRL